MGDLDPTRPSWLAAPCPRWCTRAHGEDDHPEDRVHQSDGESVACVVGHRDPHTLHHDADTVDVVVQQAQHVDEVTSWIRIAACDSTAFDPVALSPESADRLARVVARLVDQPRAS